MNPLDIRSLVKRYPGFTLDLSLQVRRGFVTGLVGANGSGKTTTVKCALGLVHPDSGEAVVAERNRVAVVLDRPPYAGEWSVAMTGRILAGFHPSWDSHRFEELIAAADIPPGRRIRELSRGMGVKLQMAAALSHDANFLILDEPTSGLDPFSRDQLLQQLAEFMTDEDHTVLFSTHITTDLDRIADYITLLDHGHVLHSAEKDALLDHYRLAAGGLDDLPDETAHLIGLRRHRTGWDALVDTAHLPTLETRKAGAVQLEPPTLDDIIVRLAQEHRHA